MCYTYDNLSRVIKRTVKSLESDTVLSEETFTYDAAGNITDTFVYDTYGKLLSRTGTSNVIFGYNGRDGVVTDDNGLIYMRARYYSPEMTAYIVRGEILNNIFGLISVPIDKMEYLPTQYESKWCDGIIKRTKNSVKNHSMAAVISALGG